MGLVRLELEYSLSNAVSMEQAMSCWNIKQTNQQVKTTMKPTIKYQILRRTKTNWLKRDLNLGPNQCISQDLETGCRNVDHLYRMSGIRQDTCPFTKQGVQQTHTFTWTSQIKQVKSIYKTIIRDMLWRVERIGRVGRVDNGALPHPKLQVTNIFIIS